METQGAAPEKKTCCCGGVPQARSTTFLWNWRDQSGAILCRVSDKFRMRYRVEPGLFALGNPTPDSHVFVTANYKLSFDLLRKNLGALDAWILVLDTKGINVWCAAGKRTFDTNELVKRIESEKLSERVSHRRIVVPQLGAPGIRAHEVKKKTGFSVAYGPVRSKDIPEFIAHDVAATRTQRTVTFTLRERAELIPLEVVLIIRKSILPLAVFAFVMGLQSQGIMFGRMISLTMPLVAALGIAIVAGAILHPLLLPVLPIRAFSLQGLILGAIAAVTACLLGWFSDVSIYGQVGAYLTIAALSSYLAFNFTGSTPLANKSGVKKELQVSIPLYIGAGIAAGALFVINKIAVEGWL